MSSIIWCRTYRVIRSYPNKSHPKTALIPIMIPWLGLDRSFFSYRSFSPFLRHAICVYGRISHKTVTACNTPNIRCHPRCLFPVFSYSNISTINIKPYQRVYIGKQSSLSVCVCFFFRSSVHATIISIGKKKKKNSRIGNLNRAFFVSSLTRPAYYPYTYTHITI